MNLSINMANNIETKTNKNRLKTPLTETKITENGNQN